MLIIIITSFIGVATTAAAIIKIMIVRETPHLFLLGLCTNEHESPLSPCHAVGWGCFACLPDTNL